jgi:hypothetical protein
MKRDSLDELIGHQVRILRLERNLSQQELGALIGACAAEVKTFRDRRAPPRRSAAHAHREDIRGGRRPVLPRWVLAEPVERAPGSLALGSLRPLSQCLAAVAARPVMTTKRVS